MLQKNKAFGSNSVSFPKNNNSKSSNSDLIYLEKAGIIFPVKKQNIKLIKVEGNYTKIIDCENNTYTKKKSLKNWEEYLSPNQFYKVHRNLLINKQFIKKIENWHNYTFRIELEKYEDKIQVSKRYSQELKKRMNL